MIYPNPTTSQRVDVLDLYSGYYQFPSHLVELIYQVTFFMAFPKAVQVMHGVVNYLSSPYIPTNFVNIFSVFIHHYRTFITETEQLNNRKPIGNTWFGIFFSLVQ
jgi:hypothetical protein